jgi:poly(A) polymerase
MNLSHPVVIARSDHPISRKSISQEALKVLYRLKDAGFEAAIVGGAIRDLLTGLVPKDFDVVTDATPEEVYALFRNCRLVGRRFRLAHVYFGRHFVEVATFRKSHEESTDANEAAMDDGMILRDNVYGSMSEDVWRRDFTINSLYYRLADFSLLDYVGAMEDIENRRIRTIGDPFCRFREDPVRMLRAVRFAVKLDFELDPVLCSAIDALKDEIRRIPPARLFDESLKLFQSGQGLKIYEGLCRTGLFDALFPQTHPCFSKPGGDALLRQALINTDNRLAEGKSVNPAFILSAILWEPFQQKVERCALGAERINLGDLAALADQLLADVSRTVSIHRRFCFAIKDIWLFQGRFERREGKKPQRFMTQQRFRAAYDFMLLRAAIGQVSSELADWWTRFQELDPEEQSQIALPAPKKRRRKKKKPRQGEQ